MITTPSQRFLDALKGSHERRLRITLMLRDAQGQWYYPGEAGVVSGTLSIDGSSASWRRLSADLTVPPEWTSAVESATFNGELKVEMGIGFGGVENLLTANQASLETDTAGWGYAWQCNLSRVASTVDGSWGLRMTSTVLNGGMAAYTPILSTDAFAVRATPGRTYTGTGVISSVSAAGVLGIEFRNAAGSAVGSSSATAVTIGQSARVTATAVAPAGTVVAALSLYAATGAVGQIVEGDAFGIWEGGPGEWTMPGTAVDWVQVAQLRIEEWERASDKATRSFLAYDRVMRVNDFPFVTPYTPRDMAGTQLTVVEGIKDIITTAFPSTDPPVFVVDPTLNTSILPPAETSFTGARWDAVTTLAQSIAAVVYNDELGRFIIAKALVVDAPVLQITGGTDGTMVSQQYQHTRVNQHNAIGLTCEAPNGDGIFVYVVDNDPQSPTYYDGPFGRKPFMTRNDTITDVDLAIAAAKSLLALKKSGAADMDVSTVYHPLLLPRDVVSIRRVDTAAYESQVIDSIELSLVKGTMGIKTHKWTPEPVTPALRATVAGRSVLDGS